MDRVELDETLTAPLRGAGGDHAAAFAVGTQVAGRYAIVRFMAAGGMGEVFEAEDLFLGTRVALKAVKASEPMSSVAVQRLVREISLARKVTHPNVCRLHDVGEHGGRAFLTMELLDGETLASRLHRGPLDDDELERIAAQLVAALAALHAEGIVHRDFKSANVILVGEGEHRRAVVTDFGLAKRTAIDHGGDVTGAATLLGTPAYMAPEQVEGRPATTASDIYSLGVVLFEMVTRTLPFHEDTLLGTATARLTRDPPRASERRPDIALRWDNAIARCLERDPARRPARVEDVLAPRGRRRVGTLLFSVAGGLAVAAAATSLALRDDARPALSIVAPPEPACASAASKLVGVWDPATRARIAARFESSDLELVHQLWRGHARQLDAETADWARLWEQACAAGDRLTDPLLYGQRLSCLESSLLELRAFSTGIANPAIDVEAFALASPGDLTLTPPRMCERDELLRAQVPLPPVAARPAIDALMTEFHRLRFEVRFATLGPDENLDTVLARLTELERRADELGYPAGAGEIAFWHGAFFLWFGRLAEAEEAATALIDRAEQTRDDTQLLHGLILQVHVRAGRTPYDAAGVEATLARATRVAARVGNPPHLLDWIEEARVPHLIRMRRYQEAVDTRLRLAAIRTELEMPSMALWPRGGAAMLRAWNGEIEQATVEARAILQEREAVSGSSSVLLADDLVAYAFVFATGGDSRTALAHVERAIEIYQRAWRGRPGTDLGPKHVAAAGYAARLGELDVAERHVLAAVRAAARDDASELAAYLRIARSLRRDGHRRAAELVVEMARHAGGSAAEKAELVDERRALAAETRRAALPVATAREARDALGAEVPWSAPERGDLEARLGIALLDAGKPAAAIEHLEQAIWIHGICCAAGAVITQDARVALADALWRTGGDRAIARRHAKAAHAALAAMGPALADKTRAAAAWLAAHRIEQ